MPTPFQNLVSGNFANYFAATPAGQLISWLGSLGQGEGAVGSPSQFNVGADQDPYNPANYGMGGTPANFVDYSVPQDIPTGLYNNETVVLNPFYVPAGRQTGEPAFNPWANVGTEPLGFEGSGFRVISDPFQIANYVTPGAGGGGAAGTGLMGVGETATSTATTSVTPSGQPAGDVTVLPTMSVTDTKIDLSDLGFGGNLYGPFAGQLPGTITPGAGGVSTLNIAPQPTSTSTVTLTQTSNVTTTSNLNLVGPTTADELLSSTGGNIGINNPALQIGVTPGTETGPTMLPGMTVTATRTDVNPSTVTVTPGSTGGQVVGEGGTLPAVTVTTSNPNVTTTTTTASQFTGTDMLNELISRQAPTVLPAYTVTTSSSTATNVTTQFNPNTQINLSGFQNQPFVGPISYTGTATSTATSTTASTTTNVRTDVGTTSNVGTIATNTLPGIGGGQGRNYRDFALELGETTAALQAKQADLLNMYGGIYQNFLNQTTIPQAATSSLADLAASQAKLDRVRAGQLSPEDIRNSQQAAREAYAARGQVMGPGAISSEILNRENIRQQREDQARAAYQSAMGNVLNTANLQTGNIFQPIGSLISGTFNPLSSYASDVYGTNVNAQLARDIANQNNAAAIQAAMYGANATRSASNTAATVTGVKLLISCMPGEQIIDTPTGPVAVENLRGGDYVIGPDNFPVRVMQVSSYVQDPTRLFIRFTLDNGEQITVCDLHKIMGIPAIEWTVGSKMGARTVTAADPVYGINRSYDLLTEVDGYQIHGVSVNSMIPEMIELAAKLVA